MAEQPLAVDPHRHERPHDLLHVPAVPVEGPALPGGIATAAARVRLAAGRQVVGHGRRNGLSLVGPIADPSRAGQHPAEPGQVPHRARHAAGRHCYAAVVEDHRSVVGSAHGTPDAFGHTVDPPLTGGPGGRPGQHVGNDRLVQERPARFCLPLGEAEDGVVDTVGTVPVRRHRRERHGHPVPHDVGPVVAVVLDEADSVGHVQCVGDRHRSKRRVGQVLYVVDQQVVEGNRPVLDGQQGQDPGDRLGHGEHGVPRRRPHAVEIPLKHHLTPVQDQKCIGVGAAQHLVERPGTPVPVVDGQVVEVDPRLARGGHGEWLGQAAPPADPSRCTQFVHVGERPPDVGPRGPIPVVDPLVVRRRVADHQAVLSRREGFGQHVQLGRTGPSGLRADHGHNELRGQHGYGASRLPARSWPTAHASSAAIRSPGSMAPGGAMATSLPEAGLAPGTGGADSTRVEGRHSIPGGDGSRGGDRYQPSGGRTIDRLDRDPASGKVNGGMPPVPIDDDGLGPEQQVGVVGQHGDQ